MPSHIHQRTHYGTHHITQKSVSCDSKHPLIALYLPPCIVDAADIGFGIGVQLAEACEIAISHQS